MTFSMSPRSIAIYAIAALSATATPAVAYVDKQAAIDDTITGTLTVFEYDNFETDDGTSYDLKLARKKDRDLIAKLANSPSTIEQICIKLTAKGTAELSNPKTRRPFFFAYRVVKAKRITCRPS